jgi:hypothetical protein
MFTTFRPTFKPLKKSHGNNQWTQAPLVPGPQGDNGSPHCQAHSSHGMFHGYSLFCYFLLPLVGNYVIQCIATLWHIKIYEDYLDLRILYCVIVINSDII